MPDTAIPIVVNGALGKMGQTVLSAVLNAPDTCLVACVDVAARVSALNIPSSGMSVPLFSNFENVPPSLTPKVVVDFTNRSGFLDSLQFVKKSGTSLISGSTGIHSEDYELASDVASAITGGIVHAANFALGAVVLEWLVKKASPYFDYADIVESHHEVKEDAPSGTAISIAKAMACSRENGFKLNTPKHTVVENVRGGQHAGIAVHSIRTPGRVARHEVIFGALGQTLTVTHESLNRESFMPGVLAAVRYVVEMSGFTVGLDKVLGLNQ